MHTHTDKIKKPSESYNKSSFYYSQQKTWQRLGRTNSKGKKYPPIFSFDTLDSNTYFLHIYKNRGGAVASCWAQPLIQGSTLTLEAAFSFGLASQRREGDAAHLVSSCWREKNSMTGPKGKLLLGCCRRCPFFSLFIINTLLNWGSWWTWLCVWIEKHHLWTDALTVETCYGKTIINYCICWRLCVLYTTVLLFARCQPGRTVGKRAQSAL